MQAKLLVVLLKETSFSNTHHLYRGMDTAVTCADIKVQRPAPSLTRGLS